MNDSASAGLFAGLGIIFILLILLLIAVVVVYLVARWKVFKKAGKEGWEAIIPFYGDYVYVKIAELNWWWFLILLAPTILSLIDDKLSGIGSLANLVASFVCNYNVSKKFHKNTTSAILMTIFPIVLFPIIAFDKDYVFDNNVKVSSNGVFDDIQKKETNTNTSNTNENSSSNEAYCPNCGNKLKKDEKFCSKCGKEVK